MVDIWFHCNCQSCFTAAAPSCVNNAAEVQLPGQMPSSKNRWQFWSTQGSARRTIPLGAWQKCWYPCPSVRWGQSSGWLAYPDGWHPERTWSGRRSDPDQVEPLSHQHQSSLWEKGEEQGLATKHLLKGVSNWLLTVISLSFNVLAFWSLTHAIDFSPETSSSQS